MTRRPAPAPASSATALAAVLVVGGALHLVSPRSYEPLIPRALGRPRPWVVGSGVAELVCGLAVALPATRRVGGLLAAGLFVAIFPGNVTMAAKALRGGGRLRRAVTLARLPLQVPLVLWALRVAARATPLPATQR